MKKQAIVFVTLTDEQIAKAKAANGSRKKITHALTCGSYGQRFGTEKQLRNSWLAWNPQGKYKVFNSLFDEGVATDDFMIREFENTFDLVNILIEADSKNSRFTIR